MRLLLSAIIGLILGVSVHGAAGSDVPPTKVTSSNSTVTVVFDQPNHIYDLSVATSGGATNGIQQLNGFGTNTTLNAATVHNGAHVDTNFVGQLLTTNGPVINIVALGAVGDGLTDNYTVITNALSMAFLSPSNTVYFPPGTYFSSKAITVPIPTTGDSTFTPGIILRGEGINRTVLYFPGSAGLIYKGAAGGGWSAGVIMDMSIQGAVTNNAIGINAADIKAFDLERVMVGYWGKAGIYLTNVWESQLKSCRLYPAGDSTSGPLTMDNTYECSIDDLKVVGGGTNMLACIVADRFISTVMKGGDIVGNGLVPHFALQQVQVVTNISSDSTFMVIGTALEKPGQHYVIGGQAHDGNGLTGNGWSFQNLIMYGVEGTLSGSTNLQECVMLTNVSSAHFYNCRFDGTSQTTNQYDFWGSEILSVSPGPRQLSGATNCTYISTNGVPDTSASPLFTWEYTRGSSGNVVPTSFGNPNDSAGVVSIGPVTPSVWNTNTVNAYLNVASLGNQIRSGNPFRPVSEVGFIDASDYHVFNGYATNAAGSTGLNYYTNNVDMQYYGFLGSSGDFIVGGSGTNTLGSTASLTNFFHVYNAGPVSIGKNDNAGWRTVGGPGYLEVQSAIFIGGYDSTTIPGNGIYSKGDHKFSANKGLELKTGANGRVGTGVLSGGTATVSNTGVTANSDIWIQPTSISPVSGTIAVTGQTASTGFVVTSSNNADTNTFKYWIFELY